MITKEEFIAYLKQNSEEVDKWPEWKKTGLSTSEFTVQVTSVATQQLQSSEQTVVFATTK